jgi:Xaa-Pro aminopeptidase
LVGDGEPGEVLVFVPRSAGGHDVFLFTDPDTDYSQSTFFTDHKSGALWVGSPRGIRASEATFGIAARPLSDLASTLAACEDVAVVRGIDCEVDALVAPAESSDGELACAISELRLYKDSDEIDALVEACRATRLGFEDIVKAIPTSRTEREIDATFQFRAHRETGGVGYPPIVATGAHATVLHWTRRDGELRDGDLLLVDAGAEVQGYYTADVTRTLPINGRFSEAQRAIYELVWSAHQTALDAVRPGANFLAPHRAAMKVITDGLSSLGILTVPSAEALQEDHQFYKRYTIHGVSHMLGIDVHDCSRARPERAMRGSLAVGMVLTIEPGVYFQLNDETVPEKYRGIGVRIEDDVVVTEHGYRLLSDGLPVAPDEVETWMSRIWSGA